MTFERLNSQDLLRVRQLLEEKLPFSAMVLNILNLTMKHSNTWLEGIGDVTIYGYNKVPDEHNLFIVIMFKMGDGREVSAVFAPTDVSEEMMQSFSKLINWSKPPMFMAIDASFYKQLEKLAKEKNGKVGNGPCAFMYLPVEDALNLDIDLRKQANDEEFCLAELKPENASKVSDHWKYGGPSEEKLLVNCITHLGCTAGIFRSCKDETNLKKEDTSRSNENLVSFVVFLGLVGALSALHTLEEVRGKGLGRWAMEAASKSVAEKGLIPICFIEHYNTASRRLVERIGYKLICDVDWVIYTPNEDGDGANVV